MIFFINLGKKFILLTLLFIFYYERSYVTKNLEKSIAYIFIVYNDI